MDKQQENIIKELYMGSNDVIDCNGLQLQDKGTQKLCNFLKKDTICKCVKMEWNDIWEDGARAISEMLKENETIHTLFLGHNNMQSIGLVYLADALRSNKSLTTLYVNDNHIGDQGAQALLSSLATNCTLQNVTLEFNMIEDKSLLEKLQERQYYNRQNAKGISRITKSLVNKEVHKNKEQLEDERDKNLKLSKILQTEKEQNSKLKMQVQNMAKAKNELQLKVSSLQGDLERGRSTVAKLEQSVASISLSQKNQDERHQQQQAETQKSLQGMQQTNMQLQQRVNELLEKQKSAEKREKEIKAEGLEHYDLQQIAFLEAELTASLNKVRNLKVQKLQQRVKDLEDFQKCKVCFDAKIDIALVPCGHHVLCHTCNEKITKCPICNSQIQISVKTFDG